MADNLNLGGTETTMTLADKTTELKAEPMSTSQLDRWLSGTVAA